MAKIIPADTGSLSKAKKKQTERGGGGRPEERPPAKQRSRISKEILQTEESYPKTTRPEPMERRLPEPDHSVGELIGRSFDAFPDRIDVRDWVYRPSLGSLPNRIVNCHEVPRVLDQGEEGACTGYALAAVINFLLHRRGINKTVSPKMLYEMARRYDQWPGEQYEGSSARGAMKGWVRHGVCMGEEWDEGKDFGQFRGDLAKKALEFPGGAFYRVMHRQVRDMHAALAETGILYCTLMVHAGWGDLDVSSPLELTYDDREGNQHQRMLPVIKRKGAATSGHAVAIVGYTRHGFIIQNSWGESWGEGGFALLPYEDYLLHATDVWVAQLGVPVETDLWVEGRWCDTSSGLARIRESIQLRDVRPYIIDVGNNGELSSSGDYWTSEADIEHLFSTTIPDQMKEWKTKRILLYLHSGLNDELAVAQRVLAFRDILLANQIYPLHIMWETGVMDSLREIIAEFFTDVDNRSGGVRDWLRSFRDGLIEAKDRTFELTVAAAGKVLWSEMKENARIASSHPKRRGAMQIVCRKAVEAMMSGGITADNEWEFHIVAHSAGSIFAGHAINLLCKTGIPVKSVHLMAPAITMDDFSRLYMPIIAKGSCPRPSLYILSDIGERDDNVGPYGKSLLYLVSNAFEKKREAPLLGMERFIRENEWDSDGRYENIRELWSDTAGSHPSLIISGVEPGHFGHKSDLWHSLSRSNSHDGFDNDPATLNSILWRILGEAPTRPFTVRDLQY